MLSCVPPLSFASSFNFSPQHCSNIRLVQTRVGWKQVQITRTRLSAKGRAAPVCCTYFCLCQEYYYLTTVQINPFRPSLRHSGTEIQPFRFREKIFSRHALAFPRRLLPVTVFPYIDVKYHPVIGKETH